MPLRGKGASDGGTRSVTFVYHSCSLSNNKLLVTLRVTRSNAEDFEVEENMIVLEIVGVWFLAGLALSVVIVAQLPAQLRPTRIRAASFRLMPATFSARLDRKREEGHVASELEVIFPLVRHRPASFDREAQAKALRLLRLYVVCSECARLIDLAKVIGNSETLRESRLLGEGVDLVRHGCRRTLGLAGRDRHPLVKREAPQGRKQLEDGNRSRRRTKGNSPRRGQSRSFASPISISCSGISV